MGVLVVLLDDVQNYAAVPQFLGLLKNVLSDDDVAKRTGYLFVLSSTEDGWSSFLQKNHPIGRYFVPIQHIHPFSKVNTLKIIDATLRGSGVEFDEVVKEAVFEYTEGHPFQMQIFCTYLFDNQLKGRVGQGQLDVALAQTLDELGPILLDSLYQSASDLEKNILEVISGHYKTYTFDSLLGQLKEAHSPISKGVLASALSRLSDKGLLLKTGRGQYRVVNRLFNEYLERQ